MLLILYQNPELIIVAFDKELTYHKLETACELINAGVPYYLSHIDIFCPTLKGNMPDCGAIGMLIEKTTGKKSLNNFGKPSDLMTKYIDNKLDKNQNKIIVGDRIHTDIELGKKIGAETVLVCTGEYQNAKKDNLKINNTLIYNTLTDYLLTI